MTEPRLIALADQLSAHARENFPEKSREWHIVWYHRLAWYAAHDGDMTGAPEFPEG